MAVVRSSRSRPGAGSGISTGPAPATAPVRQASLAWPGTEETCPKCHGHRHVYYLHAGNLGVEVVGGKRVPCPVCAGSGRVRTPLRGPTAPVG